MGSERGLLLGCGGGPALPPHRREAWAEGRVHPCLCTPVWTTLQVRRTLEPPDTGCPCFRLLRSLPGAPGWGCGEGPGSGRNPGVLRSVHKAPSRVV